jgi:hypothetical protein
MTVRRLSCIAIVALACIVGQTVSSAPQGQFTIEGHVADSTPNRLFAVQVRAKHPEIRLARSAMTDDAGKYRITALPAGRYTVGINLAGMTANTEQVVLDVEHPAATVDFTLKLMPSRASVGEIVNLSALEEARIEQRRKNAEYLVELMWGWSVQRPSDSKSRIDPLQPTITRSLHALGNDAVSALLLGLIDPDVQMRRNSALMLLDLGKGLSQEAKPSLDTTAALVGLLAAASDMDAQVRATAEEILQSLH